PGEPSTWAIEYVEPGPTVPCSTVCQSPSTPWRWSSSLWPDLSGATVPVNVIVSPVAAVDLSTDAGIVSFTATNTWALSGCPPSAITWWAVVFDGVWVNENEPSVPVVVDASAWYFWLWTWPYSVTVWPAALGVPSTPLSVTGSPTVIGSADAFSVSFGFDV